MVDAGIEGGLDPAEAPRVLETHGGHAFKVMAAGAIKPQMAFPYAFRNGADFVIAGMFDFQVEIDVKIALEALQKLDSRKRPWCA